VLPASHEQVEYLTITTPRSNDTSSTRLTPKAVHSTLSALKSDWAATNLQTQWRMANARRKLDQRREYAIMEREEREAVLKVQLLYRRWHAKQVWRGLKKDRSASSVQQAWRLGHAAGGLENVEAPRNAS